ncbi:MAG: acyl-CoA dehydrogenase, partial [Ilumatobacteraceae bacterium]|nr:acyl-CoA dehydrogenase [Ilumatobacteraceae bacterium]
MDARPTPEQRELEDAADRLALKLGPSTVGDLDDVERHDRLDAAVAQTGWRALRTGTTTEAMASGVEAAIVVRAFARRACDTAFLAPVLAHDLLRRGGSTGGETDRSIIVSADLQHVAVVRDGGRTDAPALAIDVAGCTTAVALVESGDGFSIAEAMIGARAEGVDLTRPVALIDAGTRCTTSELGVLSRDDITAWEALAVTLTAADLVGAMEGAVAL